MRKRLTITLKADLLRKIDLAIDSVKIRNRSHAIEYFLNKAFYSNEIQAIVLAGGKGLRMRPYTYEIPKTMLPINDQPLLEHIILLLRKAGIKDIILSANNQGEKIKEKFSDGSRFNVNLTYSKENKDLGTGGAISKVRKLINSSPFLVIHGDLYTNIDLKELITFHQQMNRTLTMALKSVKDTSGYGQVALKGNCITDFYQATVKGMSNLVNAGIYILNQDFFKYLPNQTKFSLEKVIVQLVKDKQVSGYVFNDDWFDVGTPQEYEKAIKSVRK